jgi:hypothetical protein
MKNAAKFWIVTISVALSVPLWAARQEKMAEKQAATPAVRPGAAEMERLKFYLGEWDYTETYPKSAFAPNGGKNTGVYTSKLGPGGNSLINTFHSQGPVGDFEGLLVMTWDAKEKAYKAYVFGNSFPGAVVETGQFEGDALVFSSEFSAGGATMKLRNVTRVTAAGKLESEEFMAMKDAPETMLVHVEAKKK